MFLLTSFIAALALWSLVRIVMQRAAIAPEPDSGARSRQSLF